MRKMGRSLTTKSGNDRVYTPDYLANIPEEQAERIKQLEDE
jgi:hypothetical protein